jgi:ABC-type nitrate/sulfonate/bicarbonate transport system permease component
MIHKQGTLRHFYHVHYNAILGTTAVVVFLLAWEWLGTSGRVNPLFTSSPSRIVRAGSLLLASGQLINDMMVSGWEFALGFALSIVVGIPLGIAMGWYRTMEAIFDPFVNFIYATPRVALLPLIIIYLGIGVNSKIAIVFIGAVFAILINTIVGVKNLDSSLLKAARSFGADDLQVFRTIALPGSVPFVLSGIRLGLGHALTGVVVGELYAATAGVGYEIAVAGNTLQTDKVFVGVMIIATTGVVFTEVLRRIERHYQSWRPARPV